MDLLKFVYAHVKPLVRADADTGKLYLASAEGGYFLPPNCLVEELAVWAVSLESVQTDFVAEIRNVFAVVGGCKRKRDAKAEEKVEQVVRRVSAG